MRSTFFLLLSYLIVPRSPHHLRAPSNLRIPQSQHITSTILTRTHSDLTPMSLPSCAVLPPSLARSTGALLPPRPTAPACPPSLPTISLPIALPPPSSTLRRSPTCPSPSRPVPPARNPVSCSHRQAAAITPRQIPPAHRVARARR